MEIGLNCFAHDFSKIPLILSGPRLLFAFSAKHSSFLLVKFKTKIPTLNLLCYNYTMQACCFPNLAVQFCQHSITGQVMKHKMAVDGGGVWSYCTFRYVVHRFSEFSSEVNSCFISATKYRSLWGLTHCWTLALVVINGTAVIFKHGEHTTHTVIFDIMDYSAMLFFYVILFLFS